MRGFSKVAARVLLLASHGSWVSTQVLSDTSGWALRGNQTCPSGESECGRTVGVFVACCPAASPCLSQYNAVCCHPSTNCTDALVASGPWCGDPTWILCNNNGYFCCLPGQTCYSVGGTDGCAAPGYELAQGEQPLVTINQVQRPGATASISASTSPSATPSPTTAAQVSSSGLSTSDKIAIGIGVPVGLATVVGTWITWKLYQKKRTSTTQRDMKSDDAIALQVR